MKCPYCKNDISFEREFEFAHIDKYDNPGSITQSFSLGFGKFTDKKVSQHFTRIWECDNCGALFRRPDKHILDQLKEEDLFKE
jgi:hypothetical protein